MILLSLRTFKDVALPRFELGLVEITKESASAGTVEMEADAEVGRLGDRSPVTDEAPLTEDATCAAHYQVH